VSASNLNNPDVLELVRDTAEYIRYLKTLGVSHLGGAADIPVDARPRVQEPPPQTSLLIEELPASEPLNDPVPVQVQETAPAPVQGESTITVAIEPASLPEPALLESLPTLPPIEVPPVVSSTIPPAPPVDQSESSQPEPVLEIPTMRLIKVTPTAATKTTAKSKPQVSLFDMFGAEPEPPEPVAVAPVPEPQDTCLQDIRDEIGDCQRCKLASGRHHIVFGDGNPTARLVFVGEAPGADEDASGVPFVGRAGQLLNKIIEAIGMKREDVYICNVVKCRPPENRTPERDEIDACQGFLHRQLAIIKPKIIVSLGTPAAFTLLGDSRIGRISEIRGNFYDYRGTPLMITFHPAYLLRTPEKKREVWEDMKKVRAFLRGELKLD
jgi:DNA polymerase